MKNRSAAFSTIHFRGFLPVLLVSLLLLPPAPLSSAETKSPAKSLVVIGVKNEVDRPELENQLIGHGISSLLLQKLFDTGGYVPIENNPEIIAAINGMIQRQWAGKDQFHTPADAARISEELHSDAVAYAKIIHCGISRSKGMIGIFSKARTMVRIEIEIYLQEKNAEIKTARGEGEAATDSSALFYDIRDNKIYFDQTSLGRATQKAIDAAVEQLW
ncbi:MAG: hypothetical protein ACOZF0_04305 [Thermodesulfobacteriota bacterium]